MTYDSYTYDLQNQHHVAVGEEFVFFFDRNFVGVHGELMPQKRRGHHQQDGFWQMEVGQQ